MIWALPTSSTFSQYALFLFLYFNHTKLLWFLTILSYIRVFHSSNFRKWLNVLSSFFFKFLEAQLKRKIRKKSKWYLGTIKKRRKISQAKDDSQNAMDHKIESDTEETQDTSVDHNETGNTGESSVEENEKQQNASESKLELRNNSNTCNIENELEDSRKTTACTELRREKTACNGDASSSQIIHISDENEGKGTSFSIKIIY